MAKHPLEQLAAGCRLHLQVHRRVSLVVARQQRWQVNGSRAVHGAKHEIAGRLATLHCRNGLVTKRGKPVGVIQQYLARRRKLQALALAKLGELV